MPPFVNYRCRDCQTDNRIEAPAADVSLDEPLNCSHCRKPMGNWRDLAVGDDGTPLKDRKGWPFSSDRDDA